MLLVQSTYSRTAYIFTGDVMLVIFHLGSGVLINIYVVVIYTGEDVLFNMQDFKDTCATNAEIVTCMLTFTSCLNIEIDHSLLSGYPTIFHVGTEPPCHLVKNYAKLYELVSHILSYVY